jgi:hypothetical protein
MKQILECEACYVCWVYTFNFMALVLKKNIGISYELRQIQIKVLLTPNIWFYISIIIQWICICRKPMVVVQNNKKCPW